MGKMQNNGTRMLMGKYELGKLLGQGTFGKVYYAKNTKTGQVVAIKAIDKEKVLKVGMTEQIKREISVMRLVRHPNIVQLFEVMASKTKIYFVMECVKGGELFNKVAKGKLKEDAARKYFQQLISAVDFCHSRGVYHRDLKPENLLLDESGNLKVSDFGLSAVTQQLRQDGLLHTTCGTPAYVAPEVITRKGYDGAKADVWSCGVILYVLMAGYLPFHDPNLMVMYKKICKGEFKCPSWFSNDVKKLMNKLLDPNPKTRITIPQLMEVPWFKKNFKPVHFEIEDDDLISSSSFDEVSSELSQNSSPDNNPVNKPASLNAFDIISFSRGFDLSGLFEEQNMVKNEKRFTSTQPVSNIITKLEEVAKLLNFNVKTTDCKIRMQEIKDGRKGNLVVIAEIFEVTPSIFVVELRKASGDTKEYEEFCNQKLKPALKDIVWVWQDDAQ